MPLFRSAFFAFLLISIQVAHAQDVWQLMTAADFHQMKSGPKKSEIIRDLEFKGWIRTDTITDLQGKKNYYQVDLTPFVDETGEAVFLVSEVSPEFPGGEISLFDYLQNAIGDVLAKPNESVQNAVYIKFSVTKTGKIEAVEAAQHIPEWIPSEIQQRCLAAVRDMPDWSPGNYRGRPVRMKMLLVFRLKE